ncbi:MAG: primosomal protein N' [Nitrospirae bacterium]|nr:primosomal protein N' [Nitrospirota bacterium]
MEKDRYAVVAVARDINKLFHYSIPEHLSDSVSEGIRVIVPFGRYKTEGYVTGFTDKADVEDVKEIIRLVDDSPLLTKEMLQLSAWIADYYLSPIGVVIKMTLPAGLGGGEQRYLRLKDYKEGDVAASLQKEIIKYLAEKGEIRFETLSKRINKSGLYQAIAQLKKKGIVEEFSKEIKKKGPSKAVYYKPKIDIIPSEAKGARQIEALRLIMEKGEPSLSELKIKGISANTLQGLCKKGLIERIEKAIARDPFDFMDIKEEKNLPALSVEQEDAVKKIKEGIESGQFTPYLLHGVTGSGKTEVYLRAISLIMEKGQGAIVLVPEIALTPQLAMRFKARFGNKVAVLHSRLTPAERYDAWRRIKNGDIFVAIGPRSAIFAPFKDLGLIVVDEEHDQLYKQEDGVRYNARDLALVRGKMNNAVVILGSATPAIETYHNAKTGKYNYLTLPERIDKRPMPEIRVVNMRECKGSVFTEALIRAVADRLEKKEQTLLFLNRRGFAPFLLCRDCGFHLQCPNCSISLTYHKSDEKIRCHYCDYETIPPDSCPQCKGANVGFIGLGTQKIEEEVKRLFPNARVARMDRDTTGAKMAHYEIVKGVIDEEIDILIGTQMIAKGHDFPRVTLVGVILADSQLFFPDFRSAEKTFQILTQVAGRAGRGYISGECIIQTYNPDHYSIRYAINQDYAGFYNEEMGFRKELDYPPFKRLASVLLKSNNPKKVQEAAHKLSSIINPMIKNNDMELLGPVPAPIPKLRGKHRWLLLIKGKSHQIIKKAMTDARHKLTISFSLSGIDIEIDIDPQVV